jgi:hypothetical protein
MVSKEDIVLEKLMMFHETRSDECLKDILVVLNKSGHELDYDLLQKDVDSRGLREVWEIVKGIVFNSKLNY